MHIVILFFQAIFSITNLTPDISHLSQLSNALDEMAFSIDI